VVEFLDSDDVVVSVSGTGVGSIRADLVAAGVRSFALLGVAAPPLLFCEPSCCCCCCCCTDCSSPTSFLRFKKAPLP